MMIPRLFFPLLLLVAFHNSLVANPAVYGAIGGLSATLGMYSTTNAQTTFITLDTGDLDIRALERMAQNLELHPIEKSKSKYCYERRGFLADPYSFCFAFYLAPSADDTLLTIALPWGTKELPLTKDKLFLEYQFNVNRSRNWRVNPHNLSLFLASAYHQEINPQYKNSDELFSPPLKQTQSGMLLRSFWSIGWAIDYVNTDNPFIQAGGAKWIGYFWDGLAFTLGTFATISAYNKGSDLWWTYPLGVKAGHGLFNLLVFSLPLGIELEIGLQIQDSGYRTPKLNSQ